MYYSPTPEAVSQTCPVPYWLLNPNQLLFHLSACRGLAALMLLWRPPIRDVDSSTQLVPVFPRGAQKTFCQACPGPQCPSIFFLSSAQTVHLVCAYFVVFFSCRTWSHGNKVRFQGSSGLNVTLSMKLRITALTCLSMLTVTFFWKDSGLPMLYLCGPHTMTWFWSLEVNYHIRGPRSFPS